MASYTNNGADDLYSYGSVPINNGALIFFFLFFFLGMWFGVRLSCWGFKCVNFYKPYFCILYGCNIIVKFQMYAIMNSSTNLSLARTSMYLICLISTSKYFYYNFSVLVCLYNKNQTLNLPHKSGEYDRSEVFHNYVVVMSFVMVSSI